MTVLATDARRTAAPDGVTELHPPDALDDLLPRADFVILTVPHTPATEGFFNRALFQRMKRTAFFINIGRGMTTKLDDLVAALQGGEIAGAALDVYEQEPLPSEHPLWTMPNVLLTPHMAGHGPYLDDRRFEIIADNCRAFAAGHQLRNPVDERALRETGTWSRAGNSAPGNSLQLGRFRRTDTLHGTRDATAMFTGLFLRRAPRALGHFLGIAACALAAACSSPSL